AAAGLRRLGLGHRVAAELPPEWMPAAPGQGALAVEVRAGDEEVRRLVAAIDREEVALAVRAERAFLAELGGTCRVPIGAFGRVTGGVLRLDGFVAAPRGTPCLREVVEGPASRAEELGRKLAARLLERGAGALLEAVPGAGGRNA